MTATWYDNVRAFIGIPYLTSNSSADISLLVSTKQAKINIFPRTTISPQDFYNGKIPPEQVYSVSSVIMNPEDADDYYDLDQKDIIDDEEIMEWEHVILIN